MAHRRTAAAVVAGVTAFVLYRACLLPGFDFGDTASFQATVGSTIVTPRDGYPLYFAVSDLFVRATGAEPAHAINLASAVEAAVACGLIVVAGAMLSESVAAGFAAAALFAVSYTFWSQSVIAEVYALHILFVTLSLILLLRWAERPNVMRLTTFFAVYALGFGNHLSMVLLVPAYATFLLCSAPCGWRSMFRPRIVVIAVACAAAGAVQYAPDLRALWSMPDPPHTIVEGLQHFWFDVTKADWRETMMLNVPRSALGDHAAMYWFDLRQQFGIVGPVLAVLGVAQLLAANARRAVLLVLLYVVNFVFAYGYNVGDTHVFYLPSHVMVALLAACGVTLFGRLRPQLPTVAALLLLGYAGWRGYGDYPALDRSADTRPAQVLGALTEGIDDRQAILITDLNWQLQNGLAYFAKVTRPGVAYARMPDVLLHAPVLLADNEAVGREVLLSERAARTLASAYGPLVSIAADERVRVATIEQATSGLPVGTRYALCVLRPSRDLSLNESDLGAALRQLTRGEVTKLPDGDYAAIAGQVGATPQLVRSSATPFRATIDDSGVSVTIRMESWLGADTIRRMGFGHVIAGRRHTLIVERGVSFVAFDSSGRPLRTAYAGNIFAPQPRYTVRLNPAAAEALARVRSAETSGPGAETRRR